MELSQIAYANTMAISARFKAFESFFWGYIKNVETKENATYFRVMFLEFYAEHLETQLQSLPVATDLLIIDYLKNQLIDTDNQIAELKILGS